MKWPQRRVLSSAYGSSSRLVRDSLGSRQQLLRMASPRCSWLWILHNLILACISNTATTCLAFFLLFSLFRCTTFSLSLTFCFAQISFFASLLPRHLHQAGCPASLSSASLCSPAHPGFLLAPTLGPGTDCAFYCTEAIHPV